MLRLHCVLTSLCYPESPRWHQGELWFTDVFLGQIKVLDPKGKVRVVAEYDGVLSGMDWLPNGDLCVVSVFEHSLLKLEQQKFVFWADLEDPLSFASNDMIIDKHGNAFVGNISFNYMRAEPPRSGQIKRVDLGGHCRVAVDPIETANGMAISEDGRSFFVAESFADRVSAFTLDDSGALTDKRVVASLPQGSCPDGICLDNQGAIWVACSQSAYVYRVSVQGDYLERITLPSGVHPLACVLGGPQRKTLFIMTTKTFAPEAAKSMLTGAIYAVEVEHGASGRP